MMGLRDALFYVGTEDEIRAPERHRGPPVPPEVLKECWMGVKA